MHSPSQGQPQLSWQTPVCQNQGREIRLLRAWSRSDLGNGFLPSPGREFSSFTEAEELEVEFGGLLECPSALFPSQPAGEGDAGTRGVRRGILPQHIPAWDGASPTARATPAAPATQDTHSCAPGAPPAQQLNLGDPLEPPEYPKTWPGTACVL